MVLWTFSQELLKLAMLSRGCPIVLEFPVVVMHILGSLMWGLAKAAAAEIAQLAEEVGHAFFVLCWTPVKL